MATTEIAEIDFSLNEILACDLAERVAIAKEGGPIEAAMRLSEKFAGTPEYYDVARKTLWAEWAAGQELKDAERQKVSGPGRGHVGDKTISQAGNSFLSLLNEHDLKKTTAYRWITMSYASREEIEKHMDTQADAGDPFKRSELIKMGDKAKRFVVPSIKKRKGTRLALPEGKTAEDVCREGIQLIAKNETTAADVAKIIGVGEDAFRQMRDIILLADRADLTPWDRVTVDAALADLNTYHQPITAHNMVKTLVARVWGTTKCGTDRETTELRRNEGFKRVFGLVVQICGATESVDLPYFGEARARELVDRLKLSEKQLKDFRSRIEGDMS